SRTREQYEQIRKRLEDEFFQRAEALKEKHEAALREAEGERARLESALQAKQQAELQELRERQREGLAEQAKRFETELSRAEEGWKASLARLREKQEGEKLEWERRLLEAQEAAKELRERLLKSEAEDVQRKALLEKEKAGLDSQHLERARDLEA